MGADEGGDEIVESGAGADFVVGMLGSSADLAVGKELTGETLAKNEELDGFAERDFAVGQSDVFLAPRHFELGFNGVQRDFLGKFLETLFVELDAVVVVANEEFVQFFG